MRRKSIAFLVTLIMVLTLIIPQVSVFADSGISVQFNNGSAAPNSNQITARFKVTNNTSSALNLADLSLKYFYTKDANVPQNFWCDHSGMMNGWNYIDVTGKVKGTFVPYTGTNTDTCLLITFASDAGSLPVGGSIEVQTRAARTDWTNYDQSNDWSYKSLGSYGENLNVCAYKGGVKVYGNEPGGSNPDPAINPTTATFDKANQADISVTLTPNGNTFKEISGLTLGSQYTVSGNTVTILKSYLSGLANGSVAFTFDFGVAVKPVLNVTIQGGGGPSITPTTATVTQGAASDLSITLIPNGSTFKGITGLTQGNEYTVSGTTVTIKQSYLNALAVGTKALTFDFGVSNNPVLTITVVSNDYLIVKAADVTGKPGDTITVPITLTNVAKVGNVGTFNLYADYDANLLQATSVKVGDIVVNPSVNFSTQLSTGSVSFVFLDNTIGSELITTDGTLATITFTVKGTSKVTTPITLSAGAFGDGKMQRITKLKLVNGSVSIDPTGPSITPATATIAQGAASDLPITLIPNGSTFKGITGLTQGSDYSVSGNSLVISKNYLNTLAAGTKVLTFDFGVANNPVLTITVTGEGLIVAGGTATGKPGDTITVPVTLTGVAGVGNVGTFNLYADYDANLLQATSVKVGDIVVNPSVNFSTQLSTGSVSFVFLDNTIGSELITTDGTLATVTFTVKGTSKVTTPITLSAGAFGDGKMQRITKLKLVNGSVTIDPSGPSITPTTSSMVQGSATSDLAVTLNANGSTFKGITGLTQGTDYTVSGTTVTILKSYLNTLAVGQKELTFDFGVTNNPILTITVTQNNPPAITPTTATIAQGAASDLPITLIPNGSTFKGITGLTQGSDYSVSGNSLVISKNYLNTLAAGTKVLTFDFGVASNPVLTITVTGEGLIVAAGNVTGKTGDTITVPVTLTGVAGVGNVGTFNLYADYDATLLEATSVKVGDIVVNAPVNFSTQLSTGSVSLVFLDNTIGSELITTDGTLATITFTVKGTSKVTTPITLSAGAFGDGKMQRITKLKLVNGSVTIDPSGPSITPTTSSMVQGSATSDLAVTLNANGSTFKGITGLTQGTDYTVSGTTVSILKSYLNALAVGTKELTFDFGVTNNPKLTITVSPFVGTPSITPTAISFDQGAANDLPVVLIPNGNTFKGITGLAQGTDYSVSGNNVIISKNYLNTLAVGSKSLTFDFGVTNNPVLAITVNQPDNNLTLSIGNVSGKAGDTITVPVTFKNVAKVGNVGTFNFYVNYDTSLLQATSIKVGDIVVNAPVNFSTQLGSGSLSFVFLDNTIGSELITTDGTLATITFTVKGTSSVTTPLTIDAGGFGDGKMKRITALTFNNGSVKLN